MSTSIGTTRIAAESLRTDLGSIPGLSELWAETLGDPRICVALLDGPVDLSHPCFVGARLTQLETVVSGEPGPTAACRHGTLLASLIFGQHPSPLRGIAPRCRGLIVPIFESADDDSLRPCSQLDLARAIALAVEHGAHVVNISGGEFSPSGEAYPLLADLIRSCARRGVLIVAAAGNEGCECVHVPAAIDSVLAVGAMDARGVPLEFSNWGTSYRTHGILAPGQNLFGAQPGGGTAAGTGTSFATAVASGVAALVLSLQLKRGQTPNPQLVRAALLQTAIDCETQPVPECRRLMAGRLNIHGCVNVIMGSNTMMSEQTEIRMNDRAQDAGSQEGFNALSEMTKERSSGDDPLSPSAVEAAECACKGAQTGAQLVYALGLIGFDYVSEARVDSLAQKIAGSAGNTPARSVAFDTLRVLAYLEQNPWDAAAITWTLSLDDSVIYAVRPAGPFAADAYRLLRQLLRERFEEGVERVCVGGHLGGTATLLNGQTVQVIIPEIRTMYSWTTAALVAAVAGPAPARGATAKVKTEHEQKTAGIRKFLDHVYHGLRNLGITAQERALNHAATNAFQVERIYEDAIKENMDLDTVRVTRSPVCRPTSDCWDVELYFFHPDRPVQTVRKVYRFTVDVSDVAPVTIGPVRSWFVR